MFGFGMRGSGIVLIPFRHQNSRARDPRRTIVRLWKSPRSLRPDWLLAHEATIGTPAARVRRIRAPSGSRRRTVAWSAPQSVPARELFPHPATGSAPTRPGSPHKPPQISRGSARCVGTGTLSAIRIAPGASSASDGGTRPRKIGNEPTRARSLFLGPAASMRPRRP